MGIGKRINQSPGKTRDVRPRKIAAQTEGVEPTQDKRSHDQKIMGLDSCENKLESGIDQPLQGSQTVRIQINSERVMQKACMPKRRVERQKRLGNPPEVPNGLKTIPPVREKMR